MRYRPELDGIRALAVFIVVAEHSSLQRAAGGWMGVDVFFVLSGYLITTLLLQEQATSGRVRLRAFYARRALRLYPALLAMIVLGAFFYRDLGDVGDRGTLAGYGRIAASAGLYVQDLAAGLFGKVHSDFGHTWSLAVEEQFYIIWPLVMVWLLRVNRSPLPWAAAGAAVSWVLLATTFKTGHGAGPDSYFLPWTHSTPLLLGCCVGLALHRWAVPSWVGKKLVGWVLAAIVAALILTAGPSTYAAIVWRIPAISLLTSAMLVHLVSTTGGVRSALGWRPLAFVGRRSYGIYLYHYPVIRVLAAHFSGERHLMFLAAVAITLAIAFASYRFVELPFLRLKHRRYEPPSHRPEPVPT